MNAAVLFVQLAAALRKRHRATCCLLVDDTLPRVESITHIPAFQRIYRGRGNRLRTLFAPLHHRFLVGRVYRSRELQQLRTLRGIVENKVRHLREGLLIQNSIERSSKCGDQRSVRHTVVRVNDQVHILLSILRVIQLTCHIHSRFSIVTHLSMNIVKSFAGNYIEGKRGGRFILSQNSMLRINGRQKNAKPLLQKSVHSISQLRKSYRSGEKETGLEESSVLEEDIRHRTVKMTNPRSCAII